MTSNRPYLLRALSEWILDNQLTPFLLVDAEVEGVEVPDQYIDNGKVVLNISPFAVKGIVMSNESVTFSARFGGVSYPINIPVSAILAIYAKENGMGMMFPEESPDNKVNPEPDTKRDKNHLKLIK